MLSLSPIRNAVVAGADGADQVVVLGESLVSTRAAVDEVVVVLRVGARAVGHDLMITAARMTGSTTVRVIAFLGRRIATLNTVRELDRFASSSFEAEVHSRSR